MLNKWYNIKEARGETLYSNELKKNFINKFEFQLTDEELYEVLITLKILF